MPQASISTAPLWPSRTNGIATSVLSAFVNASADLRCDSGFLATVQRVVNQLLEHDKRPIVGLMTGLRNQLILATEVELPAGAKRGPFQGGRRLHRATLRPKWRTVLHNRMVNLPPGR
jgi:hypothetical protein